MARRPDLVGMSGEGGSIRERHKLALQAIAFLVMLVPPLPAYAGIMAELIWVAWLSMAIVLGGVMLSLWIS